MKIGRLVAAIHIRNHERKAYNTSLNIMGPTLVGNMMNTPKRLTIAPPKVFAAVTQVLRADPAHRTLILDPEYSTLYVMTPPLKKVSGIIGSLILMVILGLDLLVDLTPYRLLLATKQTHLIKSRPKT